MALKTEEAVEKLKAKRQLRKRNPKPSPN